MGVFILDFFRTARNTPEKRCARQYHNRDSGTSRDGPGLSGLPLNHAQSLSGAMRLAGQDL